MLQKHDGDTHRSSMLRSFLDFDFSHRCFFLSLGRSEIISLRQGGYANQRKFVFVPLDGIKYRAIKYRLTLSFIFPHDSNPSSWFKQFKNSSRPALRTVLDLLVSLSQEGVESLTKATRKDGAISKTGSRQYCHQDNSALTQMPLESARCPFGMR